MRKLLSGLVVAVLVLGACGGDDDDDTASETTAADDTTDETTDETTDATTAEEDPSALAQQFIDALGFELPTDEAECSVQGMMDSVGVEGLTALSQGTDLDPDKAEDLAAALDECISTASVKGLLLAQAPADVDADKAECFADALSADITAGDLFRIGLYQQSDPENELLTHFEELTTSATVDCELN